MSYKVPSKDKAEYDKLLREYDKLKLPKRPGLCPYDENGNLILRPTTNADRRKYRKNLKCYKKRCAELESRMAELRGPYVDE